jgi:radical SAM protein with 4Fe4S-binding SPASM domain
MLKYVELRSAPRVDLGRAVPLAAPFTVFIEPTNVCNFRCVMCPESFPDYQELAGYYQRMPMELYEKIVEDLRDLGRIKALKFYFEGEPLLHPELGKMIRIARLAGVADRTEVTSNASLLTDERCAELVQSGLDYIRISVYAVDEDGHRELTGSKLTPRQILENVRRLRTLRENMGSPTPVIYAQYLHQSAAGEARFVETYSGVADELGVDYRHNWNGSDERKSELVTIGYSPDPQGVQNAFRFGKQACPEPFYTLAVKANGDVSPCCIDWNGKLKVGNVLQNSLKDIWHSAALRKIQRLHLAKRRSEIPGCRDCTLIYNFPDNIDGLTEDEFAARIG